MKEHSLTFNFFMNSAMTVINFIFPLITFPYVSRILTPESYGGAEFALNTAQLFALVALLGVNTYGLRECAKVRDDPEKLAKTFQELLVIIGVWTLAVTAAYYVSIALSPLFSGQFTLLAVAGALIPLTTIGFQWFMSANEQYAFMAARNFVIKIAVVLAMFLFVHTEQDVVIWVVISVASTGLASIANALFIAKNISFVNWRNLSFKKHIKPLLIFFLTVASISIYTTLDSVMLGAITDSAQVGYYSAAIKIKNVFTAIMSALANVLIPRMAYYLGRNDEENYYRVVNLSVHAAVVYGVFAMVAGAAFAEPIVLLLAGQAYSDSVNILMMVMPAVCFISLTQVTAYEILTPRNQEKPLAISYAIGGATDIILNLLLIPSYHAMGAAIATTVSECIVLILQCAIILRTENARPYLRGMHRVIPGVAFASAILVMGRLLLGPSLASAIGVVIVAGFVLLVLLFVAKEPLMMQVLQKAARRQL